MNFRTQLDENIWNRLKEVANDKNIETQKGIADLIGIHAHYLSAIKTGRRSFGPMWIRRICQRLEVSQEWLISKNNADSSISPDERMAEMKDMLNHWKALAEHWRARYEDLQRQYGDKLAENPQKAGSPKYQ
jgi:DNA-binding Xre family transcriptional regulator